MNAQMKKSQLARLSRIEGQVRGLSRMVEDDRYCIDIITQISAVRAALKRVEQEILTEQGLTFERSDYINRFMGLSTDAYHAALAIEHGAEWITTDRDYARFTGLRWRHPLDTRA